MDADAAATAMAAGRIGKDAAAARDIGKTTAGAAATATAMEATGRGAAAARDMEDNDGKAE